MNVDDWAREFQASHPVLVAVTGGTIIGLMVAYAKAREKGILPEWRWWFRRGLLVPFFCLAAGTITEAGGLTTLMACFITSILNIMGFAAVEMIERRASKAIEGDPPNT